MKKITLSEGLLTFYQLAAKHYARKSDEKYLSSFRQNLSSFTHVLFTDRLRTNGESRSDHSGDANHFNGDANHFNGDANHFNDDVDHFNDALGSRNGE